MEKEESGTVGAGSGSGSGTFVVSVSLARYFSDERALCYMAAESSRRVRWLARRVRRTFALPARVALRCRGHLLPPAEPLALLRPGDALEVIPANSKVVDLSREPTPAADADRAVVPAKRRRRRDASASPPARSPSPSASAGEDDWLREVKCRALSLVALHEQRAALSAQPAPAAADEHLAGSVAPPAPRSRRRRVRRRRAPPQPAPDLQPEPEPEQADVDAEAVQDEADASWRRAKQDAAATVIRNEGAAGARAPRHVPALPPPAPPAPAAAAGTVARGSPVML